ncbi:MAG: helix-turn-helix domain-containing protein [Bacteroidota bacterium]
MLNKYRIIWLSALLFTSFLYSQKDTGEHIDTLNYDIVFEIFLKDHERYQTEIFPLYLTQVIRLKDTFGRAQAYRLRAYDGKLNSALTDMDSAFSIIKSIRRTKTKSKEIDRFLVNSHVTKASIYYHNDFNVKALKELIKAYNLAQDIGYHEAVNTTLLGIADIKGFFGQEYESLLLSKKSLNYLKEHSNKWKDSETFLYSKAEVLEGISRAYARLKIVDSAEIYFLKSYEITRQIKHIPTFRELNILKSKIYFLQGDYRKAKDSLLKYSNNFNIPNSYDDLYYLGEIEGKLGKVALKKKYFLKADSILQKRKYPIQDNVNFVYQFLLQDAIEQNDRILEREYFNRLVYYDTLLTNTHERLRDITLHEFDLPLEEEEKNTLAGIIQSKSKWLNLFYIVSTLLLLGTLALYFKYRNTQKKLALALYHPVTVVTAPALDTKTVMDNKLNQEVISPILSRLEVWEKEKGFLDSTINQQDLAKQLGTNSTYLSQAINLYKGQNFSSYIKDLRITLAINTLKENPGLAKEKSMIQLAELFGFNSLSVFNKAFKSKIGVTPGVFLKQLFKTKG